MSPETFHATRIFTSDCNLLIMSQPCFPIACFSALSRLAACRPPPTGSVVECHAPTVGFWVCFPIWALSSQSASTTLSFLPTPTIHKSTSVYSTCYVFVLHLDPPVTPCNRVFLHTLTDWSSTEVLKPKNWEDSDTAMEALPSSTKPNDKHSSTCAMSSSGGWYRSNSSLDS